MKAILHDHDIAKSIKVGSIVIVEEETRSNSDSSCGLYVTKEVRTRARLVQNAKLKKAEIGKVKLVVTMVKKCNRAKRREDAYLKVNYLIKSNTASDLQTALMNETTNLLLDCLFHVGVDASKLEK